MQNNEERTYLLEVGEVYELKDGTTITIMGRHEENVGYETVYDEYGHHRYDRSTSRSDTGRCTGTKHDYSHPQNLKRKVDPSDPAYDRNATPEFVLASEHLVEDNPSVPLAGVKLDVCPESAGRPQDYPKPWTYDYLGKSDVSVYADDDTLVCRVKSEELAAFIVASANAAP